MFLQSKEVVLVHQKISKFSRKLGLRRVGREVGGCLHEVLITNHYRVLPDFKVLIIRIAQTLDVSNSTISKMVAS